MTGWAISVCRCILALRCVGVYIFDAPHFLLGEGWYVGNFLPLGVFA